MNEELEITREDAEKIHADMLKRFGKKACLFADFVNMGKALCHQLHEQGMESERDFLIRILELATNLVPRDQYELGMSAAEAQEQALTNFYADLQKSKQSTASVIQLVKG